MPEFSENGLEMFEQENGLRASIVQAPTVESAASGEAVRDLLDEQPEVEGVVVLENGAPVGLIMRTAFFQKMGTLYGHSLYLKRPVRILMDTDIMKIDVAASVYKTSLQAMSRKQGKVYDYIIVCDGKAYAGVISIRRFLLELSQKNEAQISVLKSQQQKLLNAHREEVRLRESLEYQSASVRNLLDHADQGFLWFGEDLVIKNEYGFKCVSIFHEKIGALSYMDLIAPYFEEDQKEIFQMAFKSYFKDNPPITDQVYLMLLPSDCLIHGKNIHLEYRRIESDGQKAVMVVINDVTEKINLEKAMADEQNKQRLLMKALSCQGQLQQMLEQFRALFSGGYRSCFQDGANFSDGLNELFRAVHTFKGDFAQNGFMSASEQLHGFEDALLGVVKRGTDGKMADVERIMENFDPEEILEHDLRIIYETLGDSYFSQSEALSIPKAKLEKLEATLQNAGPRVDSSEVIALLRQLKRKNIKVFLEQYRDCLEYLANRVMKNMPIYLVEGCDVEIDPDQYDGFIKSLVHIFRNIMDHGIETDEERLEACKEERGLVACRITMEDDGWFTLAISDDGRGIDTNKVREKAFENGLYTAQELERMPEDELQSLIFADHLSTKERADGLSGRGMGMSAFQRECMALGGTVRISSEQNKGTTFLIRLPHSA